MCLYNKQHLRVTHFLLLSNCYIHVVYISEKLKAKHFDFKELFMCNMERMTQSTANIN